MEIKYPPAAKVTLFLTGTKIGREFELVGYRGGEEGYADYLEILK
jgi:hypothetical protein